MPQNLDVTSRRGDTWQGWPEVEILVNGNPLDLTGATFLFQARRSPTAAEVAFEFLPALLEPVAGKFSVPASIVQAPAAAYFYDVEITLATGRVLTPISGKFTITPDVSRP